MSNLYTQGDLVRISALFKNSNGVAADPTVVKVEYKRGSEVKATLTYPTDVALVRDSTGNYHVDLDTTPYTGFYTYRWYSTGTGQAAEQDVFRVQEKEPA